MKFYDWIIATKAYKKAIEDKTKRKAISIQPQILPNSRVLDVGCGNFYVGRELIALDQSLQVTGLDRVRFPEIDRVCHNGHLMFKLGDAEHMPFEQDYFDASYSITALHHMKEVHRVLQEMKRVTRPNGRIIVLEDGYVTRMGKFALCLNDIVHNFFKPNPSLFFHFRDYDGWTTLFKKLGLNLVSSNLSRIHGGRMLQYQFNLASEREN